MVFGEWRAENIWTKSISYQLMSCLTLFSQYIPSYLNETWYSIIRKGSQTVVLLCVLNNAFEKSINSNNAFLFIYGDLRNSNKISKLFIASFCGLQFFRIHLCKKFYSRNMSCLIHFNLSGSEYSFLHSSFRVVIIPIVRPFNNWLLKFFSLSDQFRSIHFFGGGISFHYRRYISNWYGQYISFWSTQYIWMWYVRYV